MENRAIDDETLLGLQQRLATTRTTLEELLFCDGAGSSTDDATSNRAKALLAPRDVTVALNVVKEVLTMAAAIVRPVLDGNGASRVRSTGDLDEGEV